jgi:hypothetical protein
VSVQDMFMICTKHTIGSKIIFNPPNSTLADKAKWKLVLVYLETVLVSVQDRCMVCAKHTIGSEIILDAHDETTR